MNKRVERYLEMARKLSYFSNHDQHKLGAVVVYKNRVQGFGFNQRKTHTKAPNDFKNIHAEWASIMNCGRQDLTDCDIFVFRATKNGVPACSRPCSFCRKFIKEIGIKRVYYSDTNGWKEEVV